MDKLFTPAELAYKFLPREEPLTQEAIDATETLVNIITQVSKIRLQEVFDELQKAFRFKRDAKAFKKIYALRKKYQQNGTLFNDEMKLVEMDKE